MISLRDVEDARDTIGGLVRRTSLVRSGFLSDLCGGEVFLKLENLQVTGSFKIRGALNRMLHLTAEEKARGVVTASAGNHGLAVAVSGERLGVSVKIVVPVSTPKVKIDKIKKHDAELVLHGDIYDNAEREAIDLARREGLTYVSPYNDRLVIAGQGTIGLEILEDLPGVDTVLVPVGGGGLISGISVTVKGVKPRVRVLGVQSEASPVMYESLKAGKIVDVEMRKSIADGLFGGIEKDSITFPIVQEHVDNILLVKEETIRKAIFLLWEKEKQVTEGAAAIPIAAITENKNLFRGKTTVAIISGGNIENKLFQSILASETTKA